MSAMGCFHNNLEISLLGSSLLIASGFSAWPAKVDYLIRAGMFVFYIVRLKSFPIAEDEPMLEKVSGQMGFCEGAV